MADIKIYKTQDLVLKVTKNYNPETLNFKQWVNFIELLCGDYEFQKEAIETAIIYIASGEYRSIEDLVRLNWQNPELKEKYRNLEDYERRLLLPHKLSAVIDLATGTGKSYVIYGIAQIALGLGIVDRVLVLCPSLTIERGLKEKFINLSGDTKLKATLPKNIKLKNPRVIDANQTIKNGDICIENIHAVYERTGSSIEDSLLGKGERTLVLNDEVHHAYNQTNDKDIRKWKEFLLSQKYNFKYMLGFTGTAYLNDEYFNDVIYRYSVRQAVDDKIVKSVDYVTKDEIRGKEAKLQEVYDNHLEKKSNYRLIKPLSILVTKDISRAKILYEDLVDFLSTKEQWPKQQAQKKVLIITSHKEHKKNISKLQSVDDQDNPVEWIVSVSMLTEGWDVKNVFQIIPWEDRAFNSKLLIAQVLGRGLRIPPAYKTPQPKVRVCNHEAWSRNIRGLVDEILEIEMKVASIVLVKGERVKYNFELLNINYEKNPIVKKAKKDTEVFDYRKGYIELISQVEEDEKETEYTDLSGRVSGKKTLIQYGTYSVKEVIDKIMEEFSIRDWEAKVLRLPGGDYKNKIPPREEIENIIKESLKRRGIKSGRIVEVNRIKILQAFGTLLRKKGKTIVNIRKAQKPFIIETKKMDNENMSVGNLRRGFTIFHTENYKNECDGQVRDILNDVLSDESLPRSASKEINHYKFKTPLSLVITRSEPEKKFVEDLCRNGNVKEVDAWIKSRDQDFYSIEYSWRKGEHPIQNTFNPDFFIKCRDNIVVVEIKPDGDDSPENRAKYRWAKSHFEILNKEISDKDKKQAYFFHFLSPNSYTEFFRYLSDGRLFKGEFRSQLEDLLEQS